jgi:hypothetical protein
MVFDCALRNVEPKLMPVAPFIAGARTNSTTSIEVLPVFGVNVQDLSGTIIRGTLKTPNSQLVTPISTKLQRPDGCD